MFSVRWHWAQSAFLLLACFSHGALAGQRSRSKAVAAVTCVETLGALATTEPLPTLAELLAKDGFLSSKAYAWAVADIYTIAGSQPAGSMPRQDPDTGKVSFHNVRELPGAILGPYTSAYHTAIAQNPSVAASAVMKKLLDTFDLSFLGTPETPHEAAIVQQQFERLQAQVKMTEKEVLQTARELNKVRDNKVLRQHLKEVMAATLSEQFEELHHRARTLGKKPFEGEIAVVGAMAGFTASFFAATVAFASVPAMPLAAMLTPVFIGGGLGVVLPAFVRGIGPAWNDWKTKRKGAEFRAQLGLSSDAALPTYAAPKPKAIAREKKETPTTQALKQLTAATTERSPASSLLTYQSRAAAIAAAAQELAQSIAAHRFGESLEREVMQFSQQMLQRKDALESRESHVALLAFAKSVRKASRRRNFSEAHAASEMLRAIAPQIALLSVRTPEYHAFRSDVQAFSGALSQGIERMKTMRDELLAAYEQAPEDSAKSAEVLDLQNRLRFFETWHGMFPVIENHFALGQNHVEVQRKFFETMAQRLTLGALAPRTGKESFIVEEIDRLEAFLKEKKP